MASRGFIAKVRFALGFLAALSLAGGGAEVFLRCSPPEDLYSYLGDDSPLTGRLVPDDAIAVRFASLADLSADNPATLGPQSPLLQGNTSAAPLRLFMGSSFGFNLCGRLRMTRSDVHGVVLDRRELLHVRMAQILALAEAGIRVDEAYLVLTPIDFRFLGEHGLTRHTANAAGAAVSVPCRPPEPIAAVIDYSRLALTAWVRTGWHLESPRFRSRHLARRVDPRLQGDIDRMFAQMARVCREQHFPITVVPLPMKPEVMAGSGFAIEDAVIASAQKCGLDVVDLRSEFLSHPHKSDLYIADGHLSELGDDLVLAALERHRRPATIVEPVSRPGGAQR